MEDKTLPVRFIVVTSFFKTRLASTCSDLGISAARFAVINVSQSHNESVVRQADKQCVLVENSAKPKTLVQS